MSKESNSAIRIALLGAVESTHAALKALGELSAPPGLVITLPATESERHSDYCDIRPDARNLGARLLEVTTLNAPEARDELKHYVPDYLLVIGWSRLLSSEVLAIPRGGVIGFHPSRLPENRGRAVIPWTILQRATRTGSTLFWMDQGLDSGDILAQEEFAVSESETATTLYAKHLAALPRLLSNALSSLRSGRPQRTPQDQSKATYCGKRTAEDGLLNWSLPAEEIWTSIRAQGRPYPGAFTFREGKQMILWSAELLPSSPYWGLPGQVQAITDDGAVVSCGDRRGLLLKTVQMKGDSPAPASKVVKRHEKLGDEVAMILRTLNLL